MVKHNNIIPNIHCKKKWLQSSRGPLKVKLALNQAGKKKSRRVARATKRAATAPAPLERLRPVVHCPTQKYSAKTRLGRGFTMEELKAVKLHPTYAQRVGIAIDWRRRNHCESVMANNIARLEDYKAQLVILKKGDAVPDDSTLKINGTIQPVVKPAHVVETMAVTDEMKKNDAYTTMRVARQETKVEGQRKAVALRKAKE
jgi:large subunit ribosomal protein L13e